MTEFSLSLYGGYEQKIAKRKHDMRNNRIRKWMLTVTPSIWKIKEKGLKIVSNWKDIRDHQEIQFKEQET